MSLSFFTPAVLNSLSCSSVFHDFELVSGHFSFALCAVPWVAHGIWRIELSLCLCMWGSALCCLYNLFALMTQQVGVFCFPVNGATVQVLVFSYLPLCASGILVESCCFS